jgi:hypothetical protein
VCVCVCLCVCMCVFIVLSFIALFAKVFNFFQIKVRVGGGKKIKYEREVGC